MSEQEFIEDLISGDVVVAFWENHENKTVKVKFALFHKYYNLDFIDKTQGSRFKSNAVYTIKGNDAFRFLQRRYEEAVKREKKALTEAVQKLKNIEVLWGNNE